MEGTHQGEFSRVNSSGNSPGGNFLGGGDSPGGGNVIGEFTGEEFIRGNFPRTIKHEHGQPHSQGSLPNVSNSSQIR